MRFPMKKRIPPEMRRMKTTAIGPVTANTYLMGPSIIRLTASICSCGAFLASILATASFFMTPDCASTRPKMSWKRRSTRTGARMRGFSRSDPKVFFGAVNTPIRVWTADICGASGSTATSLGLGARVSAFMLPPNGFDMDVEAEVEWYRDRAGYGNALLRARREPEPVQGVHGGLDQGLGGRRPRHPDAHDPALGVHVGIQHHGALGARHPGRQRILRLHAGHDLRRRIEGVEDVVRPAVRTLAVERAARHTGSGASRDPGHALAHHPELLGDDPGGARDGGRQRAGSRGRVLDAHGGPTLARRGRCDEADRGGVQLREARD